MDANADSPRSSQALCVSVFGTIAEHPNRQSILGAVLAAADLELPVSATPTLDCEVRGRYEVLSEHGAANATSPDVLVTLRIQGRNLPLKVFDYMR